MIQNDIFLKQIEENNFIKSKKKVKVYNENDFTPEAYKTTIVAGLTTQLLHLESRIASFLQQGFYTIGTN